MGVSCGFEGLSQALKVSMDSSDMHSMRTMDRTGGLSKRENLHPPILEFES